MPPTHRPKSPAPPAETGLDMGPLPGYVGYMLRRAQLAVFKDFIETCAEADIRPILYAVLTVIGRNPGVRQGEVGAALGVKRSNFVSLLNELEDRGLAKRTRHETDRRSHALHLTDAGVALLAWLDGLVARHESRLVEHIGAEGRDCLIDMLSRIERAGAADPADKPA